MCTGFEIAALGAIAGGAGSFLQGQSTAKQLERQASQTFQSARDALPQKLKAQERRRGAQLAAFGKSGVKIKGTAKKLISEQIVQDEREILTDQYNVGLQAKSSLSKAKEARIQGLVKGVSGLAMGVGGLA